MIRLATHDDIDLIWQLRLKTTALLKKRNIDQWQSRFPLKEQFIDDIDKQEFYVLEEDHNIIGMMALKEGREPTYDFIYDGHWHDDLPYITIHRLAVDASYLGKGYSQSLLLYAKKIAHLKGYHYMRIDTHENNKHAIRTFTTFGFKYCGYILLADDHPTDRKRFAFDMKWE